MIGPVGASAGRVLAAAKASEPKLNELRRATDGFEAVFVKGMLAALRRSVPDGATSSSPGMGAYRDMSDEAFANVLARREVLGLGRMMFAPMARRVIEAAYSPAKDREGAAPKEPKL